MRITGLVLAAGASQRLGRPKQLLPYRGATLLDATVGMARECGFDQIVVALGGEAPEVRDRVNLVAIDVVDNVAYRSGCSSSIVAALGVVADADGLVLLLGDQPGVHAATVRALTSVGAHAPIAVCRYDDGIGHPFWFGRDTFGDLGALHGDKGVWRLIESGRHEVRELMVSGPVPIDVDTEQDYERLLAADGVTP